MTPPRILVACIGNIFLGDDGFGTAVAQKLAGRNLPDGVVLKDFGIRGIDLTYALLDPWELVILVDACARGGAPGTVYLLEPKSTAPDDAPIQLEIHDMNPMNVLRTVNSGLFKTAAGSPGRVLVVGCEPAETGSDDDGKLGLSAPVEAAIDEAIALIEKLICSQPIQVNSYAR